MSPKYLGYNSIQKTTAKSQSEDDSNNSLDQDGEDMVKIFAAFHDRMKQKVKSKQELISTECEKTIQNMFQLANELVSRQKKEIEAKVNEYNHKFEELEDEKLSIIKKLRSEREKYLRVHDSIIVELLKNEVAQEKTNQMFEKKLTSFINDTSNQLKSLPIIENHLK
ncbi:hypothetical protein RclHR1_06180013 [Rhizophagus clarus]|uniref:Uncharacterized protein n=1 Tax=Rhizophagus clarus TaxID=94130 RepID=A0A2Z6RQI8_9GLOM|nr:hypothetical protein RclHR1_06180013 [Rhizophagus clarus]GES87889.1 hypothetical protein GLOIN_2v1587926 [Rhizophagus clarus]